MGLTQGKKNTLGEKGNKKYKKDKRGATTTLKGFKVLVRGIKEKKENHDKNKEGKGSLVGLR